MDIRLTRGRWGGGGSEGNAKMELRGATGASWGMRVGVRRITDSGMRKLLKQSGKENRTGKLPLENYPGL